MKEINEVCFNNTIDNLQNAINHKSLWINEALEVKKKSSGFVRFIAVVLNLIGIDILGHVRTHRVADAIFQFAEMNKQYLTADNAQKLINTLEWLKQRTGKKYSLTILKTEAALKGILNDKGISTAQVSNTGSDVPLPPPLPATPPPPPPATPPPPPPATPLSKKNTGNTANDPHKALLAGIHKGVQLKHVEPNQPKNANAASTHSNSKTTQNKQANNANPASNTPANPTIPQVDMSELLNKGKNLKKTTTVEKLENKKPEGKPEFFGKVLKKVAQPKK